MGHARVRKNAMMVHGQDVTYINITKLTIANETILKAQTLNININSVYGISHSLYDWLCP